MLFTEWRYFDYRPVVVVFVVVVVLIVVVLVVVVVVVVVVAVVVVVVVVATRVVPRRQVCAPWQGGFQDLVGRPSGTSMHLPPLQDSVHRWFGRSPL